MAKILVILWFIAVVVNATDAVFEKNITMMLDWMKEQGSEF